VEIPYQVVQTLVFGVMTYFMMGFERNFGKISIFTVKMLPASWIDRMINCSPFGSIERV
jgi:ABC-type multidrug transport system permease subunit